MQKPRPEKLNDSLATEVRRSFSLKHSTRVTQFSSTFPLTAYMSAVHASGHITINLTTYTELHLYFRYIFEKTVNVEIALYYVQIGTVA
jgi:hypothetical protein